MSTLGCGTVRGGFGASQPWAFPLWGASVVGQALHSRSPGLLVGMDVPPFVQHVSQLVKTPGTLGSCSLLMCHSSGFGAVEGFGGRRDFRPEGDAVSGLGGPFH